MDDGKMMCDWTKIFYRNYPLLKGPKWLGRVNSLLKISTTTLRQLVSQLNGEANFTLALQVLQATYPQV
jgi:hypothetical protein